MAIRVLTLAIHPEELMELLAGEVDGDLMYHEYYELDHDRGFGNIVFEKFYSHENYQRMLVFHTENIRGETHATAITSTNLEEWKYELDWELEDDFMEEVMEILDEYIVEQASDKR